MAVQDCAGHILGVKYAVRRGLLVATLGATGGRFNWTGANVTLKCALISGSLASCLLLKAGLGGLVGASLVMSLRAARRLCEVSVTNMLICSMRTCGRCSVMAFS